MNEVIHQLMERKSVRVYTDQEISPDEKRAILHAAMAAPTAGNQQLYTILDITGNESSSHVCFYLLFDLRNLLYLNLSANPLFYRRHAYLSLYRPFADRGMSVRI